MTTTNNPYSRRNFLKLTALAGGGMMLSFNWLAGCNATDEELLAMPKEWFELNSYVKIGENGVVTLVSPNPEFGSNVKTSMPMMLAEELDVDWKKVVVEQADFYPERYDRQFTGGSQGIRLGWKPLRTAGATARQMLVMAAAAAWGVPAAEITTENGVLLHKGSGKKAGYGEMAAAAAKLEVPDEVKLKDPKDFRIIGQSKLNVDGKKIVTGQKLFTIDHKVDGMLTAMLVHPPAFGLMLDSYDEASVMGLPGVKAVFPLTPLEDDFVRAAFDVVSFHTSLAIVGAGTWELMQARKALKVSWKERPATKLSINGWGGPRTENVPKGLENSDRHRELLLGSTPAKVETLRRDGDFEAAFAGGAKTLERTYYAPFLAHNAMEPMNCFAHVSGDKVEIIAPIQAPEMARNTLSAKLGLPKEAIQIKLARMGGGFGQRAYPHHLLEAALISQKVQAPVKLVYTREDDMAYGIYRPAYTATYRAALDADNNLVAFAVKGGGIPEHAVHADRFPAGAVDHYLAEGWQLDSNITIGAFRAPRSNFIAGAEQSFLDELAELAGKDPIDFRLALLERAKTKPVGERNDYDAGRYAGVLKLVKEKADWSKAPAAGVSRGVAAYFCHNTYVAEVVDMTTKNNQPYVSKVVAAVDCGIVVNPDAAANMAEGGIIDGIGNAFYGEMTFANGVAKKQNFNTYRMIRHSEAPQEIAVHFVESNEDPTGLGEPLFPPIFGAVANALYKHTGQRQYEQPFNQNSKKELG